jgi:hypothetical protein
MIGPGSITSWSAITCRVLLLSVLPLLLPPNSGGCRGRVPLFHVPQTKAYRDLPGHHAAPDKLD